MCKESKASESDDFATHLSRVKKVAIVAGVSGFLAGLCFSVGYGMQAESPEFRGMLAMPIVCGSGSIAMVALTALLFAPTSFFQSESGKKQLKAIGTESIPAARFAIFICLVLGCGLIGIFAMGVLALLGFIE